MGAHVVSMFWGGGCQQTQVGGQAIGKNTIPQNLCSINRQGKGSALRLAGENITHLYGAKV